MSCIAHIFKMPILRIRKLRLRKLNVLPTLSKQPNWKPQDIRLSPQVPSPCLSTFLLLTSNQNATAWQQLSLRKRRRASILRWWSEKTAGLPFSRTQASRELRAAGLHASRLRASAGAVQFSPTGVFATRTWPQPCLGFVCGLKPSQ